MTSLTYFAAAIVVAWVFRQGWKAVRLRRGRAEALAARALGLRPTAQDAASGRAEFEGRIDGFRVALEHVPLESTIRIVVDGGGKIPSGIRLGGARQSTWIDELRVGGTLPRGDARSAVPDQEVARLFSAKARGQIVSAVERLGVEVWAGEVFREVKATDSSTDLANQIRNTVRLAEILARETLPACRRALRKGTHWQRLEAARILQAQGLPTLRTLATDDQAPEPVVVEALQALDVANDRPGLLAALMHQVEKGKGDPRVFAIETLATLKHRPALEPLARLLDDADQAAAVAAAGALGAIGDARAEGALVAALRSETTEVQTASAQALGTVGTVAAVEPLLELVSVGDRVFGSRLHAVAREAVQRIQARLPGAEAGRLALAEPRAESGALSLASERRASDGALSIAKSRRKPRARA
jgi:hypothetical protein